MTKQMSDMLVWRHRTSGERYVVMVGRANGRVTDMTGPLSREELVEAMNEGWDAPDTDDLDWINAHSADFDLASLDDVAIDEVK